MADAVMHSVANDDRQYENNRRLLVMDLDMYVQMCWLLWEEMRMMTEKINGD